MHAPSDHNIAITTLSQQISKAVYESWWTVDADFGDKAELHFTQDGVCVMPAMTMKGHAEIARGYAARQTNGPRLSRHLVSNLVVTVRDDDRHQAQYALTLYAQSGLSPQPLGPPTAICDVIDTFSFTEERWLISSRILQPIFIAEHNDSVMLARH